MSTAEKTPPPSVTQRTRLKAGGTSEGPISGNESLNNTLVRASSGANGTSAVSRRVVRPAVEKDKMQLGEIVKQLPEPAPDGCARGSSVLGEPFTVTGATAAKPATPTATGSSTTLPGIAGLSSFASNSNGPLNGPVGKPAHRRRPSYQPSTLYSSTRAAGGTDTPFSSSLRFASTLTALSLPMLPADSPMSALKATVNKDWMPALTLDDDQVAERPSRRVSGAAAMITSVPDTNDPVALRMVAERLLKQYEREKALATAYRRKVTVQQQQQQQQQRHQMPSTQQHAEQQQMSAFPDENSVETPSSASTTPAVSTAPSNRAGRPLSGLTSPLTPQDWEQNHRTTTLRSTLEQQKRRRSAVEAHAAVREIMEPGSCDGLMTSGDRLGDDILPSVHAALLNPFATNDDLRQALRQCCLQLAVLQRRLREQGGGGGGGGAMGSHPHGSSPVRGHAESEGDADEADCTGSDANGGRAITALGDGYGHSDGSTSVSENAVPMSKLFYSSHRRQSWSQMGVGGQTNPGSERGAERIADPPSNFTMTATTATTHAPTDKKDDSSTDGGGARAMQRGRQSSAQVSHSSLSFSAPSMPRLSPSRTAARMPPSGGVDGHGDGHDSDNASVVSLVSAHEGTAGGGVEGREDADAEMEGGQAESGAQRSTTPLRVSRGRSSAAAASQSSPPRKQQTPQPPQAQLESPPPLSQTERHGEGSRVTSEYVAPDLLCSGGSQAEPAAAPATGPGAKQRPKPNPDRPESRKQSESTGSSTPAALAASRTGDGSPLTSRNAHRESEMSSITNPRAAAADDGAKDGSAATNSSLHARRDSSADEAKLVREQLRQLHEGVNVEATPDEVRLREQEEREALRRWRTEASKNRPSNAFTS